MDLNNRNIYQIYKNARNKSWDVLIECKVKTLPVDLWNIAQHYGFPIHLYSKSPLLNLMPNEVKMGDGFSGIVGGIKTIFINDKKGTFERRRFTVAHELGHCLLNHPLQESQLRNSEYDINANSVYEYEANIFARDLLMPSIILAKLDVHTPQEIINLCNISFISAEIRAQRMKTLYQREKEFISAKGYSCFGLDKREHEILNLFHEYINQYTNLGIYKIGKRRISRKG